jgi:hypothetical protein
MQLHSSFIKHHAMKAYGLAAGILNLELDVLTVLFREKSSR